VAERAGVAVGSVYQYFEDVTAIVDALVERQAEHFAGRLADQLAARRFTRKRDAANATVDALVEFARNDPVFGALWRTAPRATSEGLGDMAEVLAGIVVRTLAEQGLADPADEDFVREVEVQVAVADALVRVAFRREPDGDPVVLTHLRRLFDLDVEPAPNAGPTRRRAAG
jgi:AcrR family transcriptional regulator